jgi:hypothetical protein
MRNNRDDEELARPMGVATQPQGKEREAMTHQGPRNRRIGRIAVGLAVLSLGLGLVGAPMTWAQTPAFTATAHGSLETFRAEESPRDGAASIRLSAARGETESFQLVLTNRSAEALRDIRISVSGLNDVAATAFAAAAVHMPKPGRTGGAPGRRRNDRPGPIPPVLDRPQGRGDGRPGHAGGAGDGDDFRGNASRAASLPSAQLPVADDAFVEIGLRL